jgi:lipopolysaccharide export system permease protein
VRSLDAYIGRTVLSAIGLVLIVIVGLDAVGEFIDELDDISASYTFVEVSKYIGLSLPGKLYEFVPFAALIGCLMGMGQLASSSELTVMRAAGVSIGRLVWMTMKPALLLAALGFTTGELIAPYTDQMAHSGRALAQNPTEAFTGKHGLWRRESNTFMHFNALDADGVAYGITLLQFAEDDSMQAALSASQATFKGDHWILQDVSRTEFSSWETRQSQHDTLRWDTAITPQILTIEIVDPDSLSLANLYRYSRYLAQQGLENEDYQLALWNKVLQPAAIGALVLIAVSFIFGPLRDGTLGFRIFAGVIVGIVFRTTQDLMGPASLVFGFSPLYAALAPILFCALVGLVLLSRSR